MRKEKISNVLIAASYSQKQEGALFQHNNTLENSIHNFILFLVSDKGNHSKIL